MFIAGRVWSSLSLYLTVILLTVLPLDAAEPIIMDRPDLAVHYDLDAEASSVSAVELWYAPGDAPWQLYGTDPDGVSPVLFTAPQSGDYRLLVVIVDAQGRRWCDRGAVSYTNGLIDPAYPAQLHVLVDDTAPQLYLLIDPLDDTDRCTFRLGWMGFDDHLGTAPVRLYYGVVGSDTWHPIAGDLDSAGQMLWHMPANLTGDVVIRAILTDRAGHYDDRVSDLLTVGTQVIVPHHTGATLIHSIGIARTFRTAGRSRPAHRRSRTTEA